MEHKLQRDKNRPSYFGNVKNRLGSKFPASVAHLPDVPKRPVEMQPLAPAAQRATDSGGHRRQPATGRPLDYVPHIRNPKLRQYYLQGGDSLEVNITTMQEELKAGQTIDRGTSEGVPEDTVFSITSQVSVNSAVSTDKAKETCPPKGRKTETSSLSELNMDSDPKLWLSPESENTQNSMTTLPASPYSVSPDAEYDKLLDVETVPLPDGQLCLLTLPQECSQREGAEALPYLKLLCRYITDCKGVVSGILLVTSNKIFFDPCKSHPLVMEHGWEEYLLSCSVDCVASISFFSDISHVYIDSAHHRKGKKSVQRSKTVHKGEPLSHVPPLGSVTSPGRALTPSGAVCGEGGGAGRRGERPAGGPLEELQEQPPGALSAAVLSSAATFCCVGQDAGTQGKVEPLRSEEAGIDSSMKNQAAARRLSSGSPGGLMFVRLRVQQSAGKKKGLGGLMLGPAKTMTRRDVWLALSQESSDELYAYLSQWRPDLCILEGEEDCDGDDEDFVLIEGSKEEEFKGDPGQRSRRSGEDWEIVSMEDSVNKQSLVLDRDPEYLTDVVKESCILEASHVRELYAELPPRTIGHTWKLSYSTSRHGSSLKSLYRKLSNTDSPTLIVIKDALDQMFGSFLSHPLRPSEKFYGTGETFLFMLHPRFKCFRWTGENTFFIKGDLDSFAIGGGSGHFGLWLDETLCLGRSSPCYTFNNCCLSETDDFRIMELEVWTFT